MISKIFFQLSENATETDGNIQLGNQTDENYLESVCNFTIERTEESASAVDMVFLISAAVLLTKVNMIWAESRMLRKLDNPTRQTVSEDLKEKCNDERRFAELVLRMCKGRNHWYNRMMQGFFESFIIFSSFWGSLLGNIYSSDAYLSLVLPVLAGSLGVIVSGVLKWWWIASIFFVSFLYGTLLYVSIIGVFTVPSSLCGVSVIIETAVSIISLFYFFFVMIEQYKGQSSDIFSTADKIMKNETLNYRQAERFRKMKHELPKSRAWKIRYSLLFMDILFMVQSCAVIISSNEGSEFFDVPKLIGLEVFQMISMLLMFLNETAVEPSLYLRVLSLSVIKDKNISS